mmetsp:Transcript_4120/g.6885  ORF Transcript_4120/g.6885 Transcript_4120/m.6885 type:complete len:291 (-) Transcript_4120:1003-1875(-)
MKVAHPGASPIIASLTDTSSCRIVNSRRKFLSSVLTLAATTTTPQFTPANTHLFPNSMIANAVETVGKDPNCNDASCLGVWDGLLADCPHTSNKLKGAGCVSSQDDTPGVFAEPWDYAEVYYDEDSYVKQTDLLILALQTVSTQHGDEVDVELQSGRYLRVVFKDGSTGESSTGEFYFTPNDTTVQFRIGSKTMTSSSLVGRSLTNMERSERIRKALRYTKIPVLRNRKRTWVFVESDSMDGFGPGYNEALGPPAEMSPGERGETRRLSDDVDPRLRIDVVETFPIRSAR